MNHVTLIGAAKERVFERPLLPRIGLRINLPIAGRQTPTYSSTKTQLNLSIEALKGHINYPITRLILTLALRNEDTGAIN
eukprot:853969-Amorphochlora_amoeboformis.AAC.1